MIKKLLIANRGEIAVRVIRSCKELGITSVAVFSDADRSSLHVRYADEAYHIGPSPSAQSYLDMDKIIEVAKKTGAQAIHPGYGFLSENAKFAERCQKEGIIFIGPSPYAILTMGDKITARKTMIGAGVPVVPGSSEKLANNRDIVKVAKEIGVPVMIKASAGGGGKGMRLVHKVSQLEEMIRIARSEAKAAFGDDSVYVEKYVESPHHIEFQILADNFGNTIHLCERECSIQRRHQKVIEETPSPIMTPELRVEMGMKAVLAAKAVNYSGAGTIEFLVDNNLNYYFLEMNTRLQVEHPITERVTGIDLVKEQIRIAENQPLNFKQEEIRQNGHAIECRIYAEDPDKNFVPCPGVIKHISIPLGLGIRHDGYIEDMFEIPIFYDPMVSKLIVWARTRPEAITRMKRALSEYKITGIKNSIKFLMKIMEVPDFYEGKYDTHFIQKHENVLVKKISTDPVSEDMAIIAVYMDYISQLDKCQNVKQVKNSSDLWKNFGRRRNSFSY